MPSKLDVDRTQVRILAIQIGVRQAARELGLNEDTVCAWANREGWMADVERAKDIRTRRQAEQGVQAVASNAVDVIAKRGQNTRLGHAVAAEKVADKLQQMDGDELFMAAPLLAQHAKHAATVFGWASGDNNVNLRLDIIAAQSGDCPVIDV